MRLNSRSKRLRPRKIQIASNGPEPTLLTAAAKVRIEPPLLIFCNAANVRNHVKAKSLRQFLRLDIWTANSVRTFVPMYHC